MPNVDLRRRDSQSVAGDDLRLIREDLAAAGVHEHLQPVNVVVAILLVVAERLDARKVLEPPTLGVKERLVDPEVVRVAVDVGDRLREGDHLFAQRDKELLEAVKLAVGLGERLRVAQRRSRPVGEIPAGVRLRDEHDCC